MRQYLKQEDDGLLDLLTKMLEYSPKKRISALNALLHPYFSDLRKYKYSINGVSVQSLLEFTQEEIQFYGAAVIQRLQKSC